MEKNLVSACMMGRKVVRPAPGEPVVEKSVNSAFIGTGLEDATVVDAREILGLL